MVHMIPLAFHGHWQGKAKWNPIKKSKESHNCKRIYSETEANTETNHWGWSLEYVCLANLPIQGRPRRVLATSFGKQRGPGHLWQGRANPSLLEFFSCSRRMRQDPQGGPSQRYGGLRASVWFWLLLLLLLLLFTFISFNPIIVIYHQESQRGQSALAVATMKGHSEIVQYF